MALSFVVDPVTWIQSDPELFFWLDPDLKRFRRSWHFYSGSGSGSYPKFNTCWKIRKLFYFNSQQCQFTLSYLSRQRRRDVKIFNIWNKPSILKFPGKGVV
jgi:hypothetical protein